MDKDKVDLTKIFARVQNQMQAYFETLPDTGAHNESKGDTSEQQWIELLREYLPTRYMVSKAQVLDSDGNLSDQIDIVIYDRQYSPNLFKMKDSIIYLPAESVYAVFEVKPSLNKAHLEYAGKKIASVRNLRRTSVNVPILNGVAPAKELFQIIGGILVLEDDWQPSMGESFVSCLQSLPVDQLINIGCSLKTGGFCVSRNQDGALNVEKSTPSHALIFFLLRLLSQLQERANVPVIDINEYAKFIEAEVLSSDT